MHFGFMPGNETKDARLFQTKITASVSKNLHQDRRGPCYLHLPIFYYEYTLLFYIKIKKLL